MMHYRQKVINFNSQNKSGVLGYSGKNSAAVTNKQLNNQRKVLRPAVIVIISLMEHGKLEVSYEMIGKLDTLFNVYHST